MSRLRPSLFQFPPPAPPACVFVFLRACLLVCLKASAIVSFLFLSDSKRTKDGTVKLEEDQNGPSPSGSGKPWLAYRRIRIAERSRLTRTRGGRQAHPPSGFAAALVALGFFHGLPILPPRAARIRRDRPLPGLRARAKPDNVHTRVYIYIYIYVYIYTYVRAHLSIQPRPP